MAGGEALTFSGEKYEACSAVGDRKLRNGNRNRLLNPYRGLTRGLLARDFTDEETEAHSGKQHAKAVGLVRVGAGIRTCRRT